MARPRNQHSRAGRRGAPGCLSALLLAAVIAAVLVAAVFIFFNIKTIRVVGQAHYTDTQIIAASGAEAGTNLVFAGTNAMEHAVSSKLPYIDSVEISRSLPNTLIISVTETQAAAYFESSGSYWLTDMGGKLLERTLDEPRGLIRIDGAKPTMPVAGSLADLGEESELRLRTYADTLAALEKAELIDEVSSIDLSGLYDVQLECFGRFEVDLGAPEELEYKLQYLLEIIETKLTPNQKGRIDLSNLIEKGEARFLEEY